MSAPHPTPAGSEERPAASTQPAPSAEPLTNEGAIHPLAGEPLQLLIDEVGRMRRALDAIYGHNEAARAAVAQHYGLHHKDISLLVDVLRRKFADATQGAPTPAQGEWHLVERDGMPPCDSETVFTGINTAGFACCFNEVTHDGVCTMQGPELSTIQMSALRWWRVLDRPAAGDAGKTGESAASDLRQRIMNLPPTSPYPHGTGGDNCYRVGHRDARHAAAELVAASSAMGDDGTTKAARDVPAERQEQIDREGWTPGHDDQHGQGEMAMAAACYAAHSSVWQAIEHTTLPGQPGLRQRLLSAQEFVSRMWPWAPKWWKPKDKRRNLVRAAALLLAEIERLDRAASPSPSNERGEKR